MTEASFTTGPWERHDTPDYAEIHPAAGRQHSAVALVGKPEDANLVAAAPELYEALADLLENPAFQTAIGGNPNAVDEMLERAFAALRKARDSGSHPSGRKPVA